MDNIVEFRTAFIPKASGRFSGRISRVYTPVPARRQVQCQDRPIQRDDRDREPAQQDAKLLGLRPNAPVLLVRGCTYAADETPLYRSVQVFSGHKFKVNISKNPSWEG